MFDGNGTSGYPEIGRDLDTDLSVRLRALERSVPPTEISDLWVFPPLPDLEDSGDFVLFTRVLPDEMRRICRVEFAESIGSNGIHQSTNGHGNDVAGAGPSNGTGNGAGNGNEAGAANGNEAGVANGHEAGVANGHGAGSPVARITEYGRVPSRRVQRVVDGFRRRLGDDREPLHLHVDGRLDSWLQMLAPESSEG